MKHKIQNALVGLVAGLALATTMVYAADEPAKKDTYPLTTCIVSGDKLGGDMGQPIIYDYKGREVRFCCKGCIKPFEKDPAKYLKLLDDAAAKAKAENAKTEVQAEAKTPDKASCH